MPLLRWNSFDFNSRTIIRAPLMLYLIFRGNGSQWLACLLSLSCQILCHMSLRPKRPHVALSILGVYRAIIGATGRTWAVVDTIARGDSGRSRGILKTITSLLNSILCIWGLVIVFKFHFFIKGTRPDPVHAFYLPHWTPPSIPRDIYQEVLVYVVGFFFRGVSLPQYHERYSSWSIGLAVSAHFDNWS